MKTAYCFDLDGTLTKQEILPLIALELDLYDEISTLTSHTISGLIPFEMSFKLRVKLLQNIAIKKVQSIVSYIELNQSIIEFIRQKPTSCFVITGNLDVWIQPIMEKIPCHFFCSESIHEENQVLGIKNILNKGEAISKIREIFDQIVVVGDGMNDVPMFEKADIGIAFGGVHEPVGTLLTMANFVTYNERGLCNLLNTL